MADINVIASFKVNNPAPADAKYLAADNTALAALLTSGNAYVGMQVYNQADNELYIVYEKDGALAAKKLLAGTDAEIGNLGDDVEELQGLHAKEGDDFKTVAQEVTAGIEALDAEVTSEDGARVTVKVTEVDGKITAVNVTEDDIAQKSELDKLIALHAAGEHDGYATVQEEAAAEVAKVVADAPEAFDTLKEIASWIEKEAGKDGFDAANRITTLETTVGAEAKAAQGTEGEEGYVAPVAATGLYKYVDEAVAAANSSADEAIEALDATVDSTGGTKVSVQVVEENGKITSVTVAEDDIASAALLGTAADDATKETAFGKAAAAQAAAEAAAINTITFATSDADVTGSFANNTLTINNVASATDLGTAEGRIDVLEGLHAAGETAGSFKTVAQEITAAIEALDTAEGGVSSTATVAGTAATADAAAVASTQHVQVTVEQENGIVSSVSVSEADIASKVVLDEEIARAKAAEKANADAIGKAKEGETAGTGLTGRIEELEAAIGAGGSVEDQIKAITGEPVNGTLAQDVADVASDLSDLDDKVGDIPADATATTVVAYAAEVAAAAQAEADGRLDTLEGKHAEGKTVAEEVTAGIEGIAEASKDNGANDLVKVTVTTKAGSVTSVAVDDSALDTKIGDLGKVSAEEGAADHTVKSFVEAKVAEVNSAVENLDKDLTGDNAAASTDGKVTVGIKQEDGLITSLTVATDDIASAEALSNLQAVVGDNGPLAEGAKSHEERLDILEGSDTTEGSVAYQIAQVVADAPEAFDTLKEIASWIQKEEGKDGFDAANRITTLETTVGAAAKTESAEGAGDGAAATGLFKYVDDAIEELDSNVEVPWDRVTDKPNLAGAATMGGSANSAAKLDTETAGDVNTPVYFVNGVPVASTFTIKTSVPENAVFTDTTYEAVAATEGADPGLMTAADKIKLDTVVTDATKVEASETNGNIKINGTETTVYTHPETAGNKHIPAGGSAGQYLKYASDGTATWADLIRTGAEVPEDLAAGELFIQLVEI